MAERDKLLVMLVEGSRLLEGSAPPAPTLEVRLSAAELSDLNKLLPKVESFKDLLSAIRSFIGEDATNEINGQTVLFVASEETTPRVVKLGDDETPGINLTHFEGAGVYKIEFLPSGESGYFLGTEMARRELTKLVTTPPRGLVEALNNSIARINALRGALETITETYGKNESELAKFAHNVLRKDELHA